jgi:hypothetical protein
VVVKAPCRTCNNVWLNKLQKPVEPFLRASIHGQPFHIPDTLATVEIATWAYKTALLIPLFGVDREDWPAFIPVRARELRKKGRPPVGVRVWVGRFDFRSTWPDLVSRSEVSELVFQTGGQDYAGYQVVFTLGFLLFMVVHWSVAPPKLFEVDPRRLPVDSLMHLWPAHVGAKSWPPERSVSYEQLGSLANFTDGEPPSGPGHSREGSFRAAASQPFQARPSGYQLHRSGRPVPTRLGSS